MMRCDAIDLILLLLSMARRLASLREGLAAELIIETVKRHGVVWQMPQVAFFFAGK